MSVRVTEGNIFTSECQTLVNTVNCVGVMGAGIALECRLRYPKMYQRYVDLCSRGQIGIGLLWLYRSDGRWILNFPTKTDWRYPSKEEYLHAGLRKFAESYAAKGITSVAFPLLGASNGGIEPERSLAIMLSHLEELPIEVEIYQHNQTASDDIYEGTKDWLLSQDIDSISSTTKLGKVYVQRVVDAMQSEEIYQLNQLARIKGVGIKTLERLYQVSREDMHSERVGQLSLIGS